MAEIGKAVNKLRHILGICGPGEERQIRLYDEVARLREERAARQVDPPGGLAPEHIKVTPGGATHWSSGPGNLTFSTQCPRCWYDQAQRLQARVQELESELRACSATLRSVEKHYGEYGVGHVI